MARFPDIPEALTCGDSAEEALAEARDALITAFEFYFEDQRLVNLGHNTKIDTLDLAMSAMGKHFTIEA